MLKQCQLFSLQSCLPGNHERHIFSAHGTAGLKRAQDVTGDEIGSTWQLRANHLRICLQLVPATRGAVARPWCCSTMSDCGATWVV